MPEPLAVCIENVEDEGDARFIRCVALAGGLVGLGVAPDGRPTWKRSQGLACELWVSADEQLVLLRPSGAPEVRVARSGRSICAPEDKPVVLLDQDELTIRGHTLRVYVHGPAAEIHAPEPFSVAPRATAAVAAALLGAAALVGCEGQTSPAAPSTPTVELPGDLPPAAASASSSATTAPEATSSGGGSAAATTTTTSTASASPATSARATSQPTAPTATPPIEVRVRPPKPVMPRK